MQNDQDTDSAPEAGSGAGQTADPDTDAFWRWSLRAYDRDGAATALLALQDIAGLNVNILLFLAWRAETGAPAGEAVIRRAMDSAAPLDTALIAPVRAARRFLKTQADAEDLYDRMKAMELEAERLQQKRLAAIDKAAPKNPPVDAETIRRRIRQDWAIYARLAGSGARAGFSVSLLDTALAAIYPPAPSGA